MSRQSVDARCQALAQLQPLYVGFSPVEAKQQIAHVHFGPGTLQNPAITEASSELHRRLEAYWTPNVHNSQQGPRVRPVFMVNDITGQHSQALEITMPGMFNVHLMRKLMELVAPRHIAGARVQLAFPQYNDPIVNIMAKNGEGPELYSAFRPLVGETLHHDIVVKRVWFESHQARVEVQFDRPMRDATREQIETTATLIQQISPIYLDLLRPA